jgi:hypothetical protein
MAQQQQPVSLNGGFWNNRTEALNILNPLIALPSSSKDALTQLAAIEAYKGPGDAEVSAAFLRAAAKHIPAGNGDDSTGLIISISEVSQLLFMFLALLVAFAATSSSAHIDSFLSLTTACRESSFELSATFYHFEIRHFVGFRYSIRPINLTTNN